MAANTCPTPLRHPFPQRSDAWKAVRGQRGERDSFRVYQCTGCGRWHWQRLTRLIAIKREGVEQTLPGAFDE